MEDKIKKKIKIAEKRIKELTDIGDIKKISEKEKYLISKFYTDKSENRLKSAKIIYKESNNSDSYNDYAEVVAAAYYSMYYIVHAFLALKYKTKLKQEVRGVHIITEYIILYYLIKTNMLAKNLYEEYLNTFQTTAQVQRLEDFQKKAYSYAQKYDKVRSNREIFTYNVSSSVEEFHANHALETAEEFINKIKEIMI